MSGSIVLIVPNEIQTSCHPESLQLQIIENKESFGKRMPIKTGAHQYGAN